MSKATTIDELYPLVTEAIVRAETLEDLGAPGAADAFLDLSLLEERVAEIVPASDPEGAIARRGAVRAALSAESHERARALADRYLAETDTDADLRNSLLRLSEEADVRKPKQRLPMISTELEGQTRSGFFVGSATYAASVSLHNATGYLLSGEQHGVLRVDHRQNVIKVEIGGETLEIAGKTFSKLSSEASERARMLAPPFLAKTNTTTDDLRENLLQFTKLTAVPSPWNPIHSRENVGSQRMFKPYHPYSIVMLYVVDLLLLTEGMACVSVDPDEEIMRIEIESETVEISGKAFRRWKKAVASTPSPSPRHPWRFLRWRLLP